jgi:hypothetical protein
MQTAKKELAEVLWRASESAIPKQLKEERAKKELAEVLWRASESAIPKQLKEERAEVLWRASESAPRVPFLYAPRFNLLCGKTSSLLVPRYVFWYDSSEAKPVFPCSSEPNVLRIIPPYVHIRYEFT